MAKFLKEKKKTSHLKGKKKTSHLKGKKKTSHLKGKKMKCTDTKKQQIENKLMKLQTHLRHIARKTKENGSKEGNTCSKESDLERVSQNVKRKLKAEDYAEVKRRRKEIDKQKQAWPRIFLSCLGKLSSLSVDECPHTPLPMNEIHEALLFSINKFRSHPRWINIIRPTKISHVVTVLVEGVSLTDILEVSKLLQDKHTDTEASCHQITAKLGNGKTEMKMEEVSENADMISNTKTLSENSCMPTKWLSDVLPRTSRSMYIKVEVTAPAKYRVAPTEELINLFGTHVKKKECRKLGLRILDGVEKSDVTVKKLRTMFPIRPVKKIYNTLPEGDMFDRRKLLLSLEELRLFSFPLAVRNRSGRKGTSFRYTSDCYSEVTQSSPMFAVDCEMCLTNVLENELTSISVVNEKLELVYHTLVKPRNPIINYLTRFSGITKSKLENVTTRLSDVQEHLRKILPPDAILVGHSLDSDLKAMKMIHPYVIDSSLSYNLSYNRTQRTSLKKLTQEFLGENIQDSTGGHDPSEDAAASLKLIKLKLQHDITFGDVMLEKKETGSTTAKTPKDNNGNEKDRDDIDSQMDSRTLEVGNNSTKNIFQYGREVQMALLMTPSCKESYNADIARMKNVCFEVLPGIKHVSKKAAEIAIQNDFILVHMKMDRKLENSQSCEERWHHLRKLDKRLGRIIKSAASKALFLFVFTGSSLNVPEDKLSNGFAMMGIKDMPFIV